MIWLCSLEYLWYAASLVVFFVWLWQAQWGRLAFDLAPQRRHGILPGDVLLIALLYACTMLAAGTVLSGQDEPTWQQRQLAWLILAAGQLVTAVVIVFIGSRRFAGGLKAFGISAQRPGRTVSLVFIYSIVVFGLTFLAMMVTLLGCEAFGYEQIQKHEFLDLLGKNPPLLSMILLWVSPALVAPLAEELLFRGLLQNFLIALLARNRQSSVGILPDYTTGIDGETTRSEHLPAKYRWLGIIIAAVLFVSFHADWQHWPALLVLGIGLGYCYERYGNLLIPIMIHSLFNIVPLTITTLSLPN